MNIRFDEITWHDTELLVISIDRAKPGLNDIVEFHCANETDGSFLLEFTNVWQVQCSLNFGVVCAESIRTAFCHSSHPELDRLSEHWKTHKVDLSAAKYFEFETNSTASKIGIVASDVRIIKNNEFKQNT